MRPYNYNPASSRQGTAHPMSKLTEAIVSDLRLRRAAGEKGEKLAKELGVSHQCVSKAVTGETWRHVDTPTFHEWEMIC